METLEYNHEDQAAFRPRAGDEKLALRFFRKAAQDMEATQEAGRPIFKEVEFIQILVPGDKTSIVVRPVGQGDKLRFGQQYQNWLNANKSDAEVLIGTPLEAWNQLSLAQVEEFRYFGVRTVEHLSSLRDDVMLKMPGAIALKKKAITFLDAAKEAAPLSKMQAMLDVRDNELAALRNALKEQGDKIAALQQEKRA